jgi:predicted peptidase
MTNSPDEVADTMISNFRVVSMAALGATLAFAGAVRADDAAAGQQKPQTLEKSVTKILKVNYLLYLPEDYGKQSDKKWPLVVFLHGSGESGSDLEKVKAHGPPKLIAQGKEFPFIVVSPQAPDGPRRGWDPEVLNAMLDDVLAKYTVEQDQVYLTGLSMGGYGTWNWGAANPERFAAVAPICGGGDARVTARRLKSMPVWAFHGAKDPVVPIQESERIVEALKKAGNPEVKFTIYSEAQHDSWTVTYDNPELYTWLLAHRRAKPDAVKAEPKITR